MFPRGSSFISLAIFLVFLIDVTDSRTLKRWKNEKITWKFDDPHDLLSQSQEKVIRNLAEDAFEEWASALEGLLEIEELDEGQREEKADITIYFAKKNHSCVEAFDGRGGVVAHSTYPSSGMLHLDGDELWHTGDPTKGDVDIRYVLIHEIGHVLGLRHSRRKGSVMRRNYRSAKQSFQLSKYDVRAIRKLYIQ